jgi:type II secretory pathway pseudopilin PulG
MKKTFRGQQGFTLLEVTIYVVLLSVFFGTLVPSMFGILQTSSASVHSIQRGYEELFLEQKLRYLLYGSTGASLNSSHELVLVHSGVYQTLLFDPVSGKLFLNSENKSETLNTFPISDLVFVLSEDILKVSLSSSDSNQTLFLKSK